MRLIDVVQWARREGAPWRKIAQIYRQTLVLNFSSLVQALWREYGIFRLDEDQFNSLLYFVAEIPSSRIRIPINGLRDFGRFELSAWPEISTGRVICIARTGRSLMRLLNVLTEKGQLASSNAGIVESFENSLANGLLDALRSKFCFPSSPEPVFCGNLHHPFPSYRSSLSIDDVGKCTPLSYGCRVPLFEIADPSAFGISAVSPADTDLASSAMANLVPIHPWQLRFSQKIKQLVERGDLKETKTLSCNPLASQRTLRLPNGKLDIKLPVDVQLLGARRLLSRSTISEAPIISAMIERHVGPLDKSIRFDRDVVGFSPRDERLEGHIGYILRRPSVAGPGEVIVPAACLWHNPPLMEFLPAVGDSRAEEWFLAYSRVVMTGPINAFIKLGVGFEPHLQNTSIVMRARHPVGIALRDLDSVILAGGRSEWLECGLSDSSWAKMPSWEKGRDRLCHSLFFGHLADAMLRFRDLTGVSAITMADCVETVWSELSLKLDSRVDRLILKDIRSRVGSARAMLGAFLSQQSNWAFKPSPRRGQALG